MVCVFLLAVAATGCFRREPPADVTIVNGAEPESLDPAIIVSQPDERLVRGIYEGLMRLDPKTGEPIPGLAESCDISPDGKIYTFHLRTNLVWSTGEPITADDVVYSWVRALEPATASDYAEALF
jgi:oligopeptide transport system substrate-binding protein